MQKKIGLLLLLFLVWWTVLFCQALWPFQHIGQGDINLALALTLFVGTIIGVPVIGYLVCADLIAKRLQPPWNVVSFVGLVAVGFAVYVFLHHQKTQVPLQNFADIWKVYRSHLLPLGAIAAILLVRRIGRSMQQA
jgi:hypothetical protein